VDGDYGVAVLIMTTGAVGRGCNVTGAVEAATTAIATTAATAAISSLGVTFARGVPFAAAKNAECKMACQHTKQARQHI
jgi:hypothetical protein